MYMWIEEKYISFLSGSLRNFKKKGDDLYNFSCPICGDSQSNKHKARGYIYAKEGKYNFMCHNCGDSRSFQNLLKTVNISLFNEYRLEKFVGFGKKPTEKKIEEKKEDLLDKLPFQKISDLPENHIANIYLNKRQIPKEKRNNILYSDNLSTLGNVIEKYKNKLPKDKRIIFPIYNRQGKLVGLTARRILKGDGLRYVMLRFSEINPLIYNLDKVNFNKKIYVLEGAMDSLFFDNAIAVDGSDFSKVSEFVNKDSCTLVFDNQPKNLEIVKKIQKMIDDDWNVVIWPNSLKEVGKDINQFIVSGMTKEEIKKIVDDNTFRGLKARIRIAEWRQV